MKYMLLIYLDEQAMNDTERERCYEESVQLAQDLHAQGQYLAAAPLHPVSAATSVRMRNGRRLVTDGPFAETKELIAGYTLIEVKSREEALEWSRRFPNPAGEGKDAQIEVRELYGIEDLQPSPEMADRFHRMGLR